MATSLRDADVAAVIAAARLCFAATVTPEGRPSLSPKGSLRILDDRRLFFLDLASPGTVRNLRASPWIELNVVDGLSRRGYRFRGRGTVHAGGEVHAAALARLTDEERAAYPIERVVVVEVEEILPIWSPAYDRAPGERMIRDLWTERRARQDAAFEEHLLEHGYFEPPG